MNAPHPSSRVTITIAPPGRTRVDALIAKMSHTQRMAIADQLAELTQRREHVETVECDCGADVSALVDLDPCTGLAANFVQQLIDALREP